MDQTLGFISIPRISEKHLLTIGDKTPLRHFARLLATLNEMETPKQLTAPTESSSVVSTSRSMRIDRLQGQFKKLEEDVDFLLCHEWLNDTCYMYPFSRAIFDPTPYLPRYPDGSLDCKLKDRFSLTPRDRQLESLKHIVNLISNNFETEQCIAMIVELTREKVNREFLRRLMDSGLATMEALAEKLLLPAAMGKNLALLYMLLDAGVNINYWDLNVLKQDSYFAKGTLLEYAVNSCDEPLLRYLIDHGAKSDESKLTACDYDYDSTTLSERAVSRGAFDVLRYLLQHADARVRSETFSLATYRGDVKIFDLLVSYRPQVFEEYTQQPWILFETAALEGHQTMCEALQAKGLDISATDDQGRGSPLAYALYGGYNQLARYLLESGASIDSRASTNWTSCVPTRHLGFHAPRDWRLHNQDRYYVGFYVKRMTAIHTAVYNGDEEVVRYFLSKGANPNQPGQRLPLQLSAIYGHVAISRVLLEYGADPDSICSYDPEYHDYDFESKDYFWCGPTKRPIQVALETGDRELFKLLLDSNAQLPTTPLCLCSFFDSTKLRNHPNRRNVCDQPGSEETSSLTEHEFWCNSEDGWNPLVNAAKGRDETLVLKMLDIAVQHRRPWITREALVKCAENLDWNFVVKLMEEYTFPPYACFQQQVLLRSIRANTTQLLKDAILKECLQFDDAISVLADATTYNMIEVVQLLLESGYWPDDADCRHADPALEVAFQLNNKAVMDHMLAYYRKNLQKAQQPAFKHHFLLAYGFAIKYRNIAMMEMTASAVAVNEVMYHKFGNPYCLRSSVHHAINFHNYDIAEWLLEHGADPNIVDEDCDNAKCISALQRAAFYENISMVRKLLEKGSNVNASPYHRHGATALQFAAISGRFDIVDVLIQAGADINAEPSSIGGRRAIEGAAEHGRLDMVSYLLQAGANIKGRSNLSYMRAVLLAWIQGHCALARMIHKWKAENDEEYVVQRHSIESILKLTGPELEELLPEEGMQYHRWFHRG
jgi:ankyrin repeat protein